MGLLDFLFGNKKEKERIERERQEEQDHQPKAEEARIAREREARLVENRRKEAERQARLRAQAENRDWKNSLRNYQKTSGRQLIKKIDLAR